MGKRDRLILYCTLARGVFIINYNSKRYQTSYNLKISKCSFPCDELLLSMNSFRSMAAALTEACVGMGLSMHHQHQACTFLGD